MARSWAGAGGGGGSTSGCPLPRPPTLSAIDTANVSGGGQQPRPLLHSATDAANVSGGGQLSRTPLSAIDGGGTRYFRDTPPASSGGEGGGEGGRGGGGAKSGEGVGGGRGAGEEEALALGLVDIQVGEGGRAEEGGTRASFYQAAYNNRLSPTSPATILSPPYPASPATPPHRLSHLLEPGTREQHPFHVPTRPPYVPTHPPYVPVSGRPDVASILSGSQFTPEIQVGMALDSARAQGGAAEEDPSPAPPAPRPRSALTIALQTLLPMHWLPATSPGRSGWKWSRAGSPSEAGGVRKFGRAGGASELGAAGGVGGEGRWSKPGRTSEAGGVGAGGAAGWSLSPYSGPDACGAAVSPPSLVYTYSLNERRSQPPMWLKRLSVAHSDSMEVRGGGGKGPTCGSAACRSHTQTPWR